MQSEQSYDVMVQKLIAERAFAYWQQRGRPLGSPEVDWFRAVEDMKREIDQSADRLLY